jgi:hypothetical protein
VVVVVLTQRNNNPLDDQLELRKIFLRWIIMVALLLLMAAAAAVCGLSNILLTITRLLRSMENVPHFH